MDHWHHGGSGICICVNVGMKGYDMYRDAISQISLKDKIEQIRSKENYTEFAELPETYVDAVLSVEDHRFTVISVLTPSPLPVRLSMI